VSDTGPMGLLLCWVPQWPG